MSRVQEKEVSSVTASEWIDVDLSRNPFNCAVYVELSPGATLTYTVQYTPVEYPNDPANTPSVFDISTLADIVDTQGAETLTAPCGGIRLNVTSYTSGTATLKVIQAGRWGN